MPHAQGGGSFGEYCAAVDAATGTNIWATRVDSAPWDPGVNYNGGDGTSPYNTGDGPRSTPSVKDGRVFALSGLLHLVCMNVTNGAVLWNDDLQGDFGGSIINYENCSSPCVDNDLLYVSLNTSTNNQNLVAFRTSDGTTSRNSKPDAARSSQAATTLTIIASRSRPTPENGGVAGVITVGAIVRSDPGQGR